MSKKIFSEKDQMSLSTNKYVIRINDKAITYADEFKQLFIDQYMTGKTPREIFEANGFDVNVIGMQRMKQCAERWRKAYKENGLIGLADSRKESSGRSLKRELTKDEVIERQEARIRLLESQVDLLKKLDMKERLLVAKGKKLSKSNLFELIKETVGQGLGRTTRYLCDLLQVSRLGYYNYFKAVEARKKAVSFRCQSWRTDQESLS